MRNVPNLCVTNVSHPTIRFEENKRTLYFKNPNRNVYRAVQVDGCAITEGMRCDKLLTSEDEHAEHFVELKGTDIKHAIEQLQRTIDTLGEYNDDRHAYVISTNVAPALTTVVQKAKKLFQTKYQSELIVKEKMLEVHL